MTIQWLRPTKVELDSGILAKRLIVCYCSTDRGMLEISYFGGYVDKQTGKTVPKTPAVINYTEDMLAKLWRNHPELMPPFVKVILP